MTPTLKRIAAAVVVAATLIVPILVQSATHVVEATEHTAGGFVTEAADQRATPGETISIDATMSADQTTRAIVDIEVYDSSGRRVYQRFLPTTTYPAGRTDLTVSWPIDPDAPSGEYTTKIGIFSAGWRLWHWNNDAGTIIVGASEPTRSTGSSAFADAATVSPGDRTTLTVEATSDLDRSLLVDLELYDASGRKVLQRWWDNESFRAGQTRTFDTSWTVPAGLADGRYTFRVGLFGAGWRSLIHWNHDAGNLEIDASAPSTTTTTTPPTTTTTAPPTTSTTTTTVAPTTSTTTTTVAPTTSTTTTSTVPPSGGERFATLPVGAALPSGSECADRVRDAAEIRPDNDQANNNRGGRQYANSRNDWASFDRVDGDFTGTTDEIIQWAACKWGIDEDMVRAQLVKESAWHMSANGDDGESWGLGQVRVGYHDWAFEYTAVNARNSSAYNLDYTYAVWRACYEGVFTWLNNVERGATYSPGDAWGCMGVWFSGRWYTQGAVYYLDGGPTGGYGGTGVKERYQQRIWEDPDFLNW